MEGVYDCLLGEEDEYIYQKHHWQLPLVTACENGFPQAVVI
jgi:hypothetical protein